MTQLTLEDYLKTARYEGPVDARIDFDRLQGGIRKVHGLLSNNEWFTLREIETETGIPQASASAFIRHLRKARFGGFIIEKRRRNPNGGTWEYKMSEREINGIAYWNNKRTKIWNVDIHKRTSAYKKEIE